MADAPERESSAWRGVGVPEALVLLLALTVAWPRLRSESAGVDYYQFWLVARGLEVGAITEVYSAPGRERLARLGQELAAAAAPRSRRLEACAEYRQSVETFSTPFLYAALGVASTGRYDTDLRRFQLAGLVALLAALALLGLSLGHAPRALLLWAALLLAWGEPLASEVRVGNVNELQLGGVALFALLRRGRASIARDVASGAVLGALVAFKPTLALAPALVFAALLVDGRARALLAMAGGALGGLLAALLAGGAFLGGVGAWLDWAGALRSLESVSDVSVANGNYALARLVLEAGGPRVSAFLSVALVAAGAARLWRTRAASAAPGARSAFERELWAVAFGCAIATTTPALVWLHYFVLALPLALSTLRPGGGGRPARLAGGLGAILLLGGPSVALLGLSTPGAQAPAYVAGAWLLALAGLARVPRALA